MSNDEGWVTVGPGNSETIDVKKQDIQGQFLVKEENVGPNGANLYRFILSNGKEISVWGSTILDLRMAQIEPGEEVKIHYLGLEKNPKTGRSFHNFEIQHRPMVKNISKKEETEDESIPF